MKNRNIVEVHSDKLIRKKKYRYKSGDRSKCTAVPAVKVGKNAWCSLIKCFFLPVIFMRKIIERLSPV